MKKQTKTSTLKQPFVSIIMPVYNTESVFLEESIKSVLLQTYKEFELLIIDDESNEQTRKILEKYEKKKQVRIISQKHNGVSAARNKGMDKARGQYIMFVDSDDKIASGTLKNVLKEMEKTNADCLIFNYQALEQNGSINKNKHRIFSKTEIDLTTDFSLLTSQTCFVWAKIFKNNEKLPRFNEDLRKLEDAAFLFEYYQKGPEILTLDKIFYTYRRHPNGISKDDNLAFECQTFKSAEYALKLIKNSEMRNVVADRYASFILQEIYSFLGNKKWPKVYKEKVYHFLINNFNLDIKSMPAYLKLGMLCKDQVWMSVKAFFTKNPKQKQEEKPEEKKELKEPVDLVYTWVDGNDETWRKQKARWIKKLGLEMDDSLNDCRFIDNQELKYSLRSAVKNAPWINHIYIVTNGQVPKWFKKHPKITFVKHQEIMPKDALPTFNSIAIESCLANIKGLSEHFLYSNDDCFFYKPVPKSFFFDENGSPIIRLVPQMWTKETIETKNYPNNIDYSRRLIKQKYGKDYIFEGTHNIVPCRKSYYLQCAKDFKNEFDRVCHHRFRQMEAIQKTIYDFWMLANGFGILKVENLKDQQGRANVELIRLKTERVMLSELKSRQPYLFCVNDNENTNPADRPNLKYFLCALFPNIQPWEKETDYQIYPVFEEKNAFVFCLDDRYCRYFGVALQSLIDHADQNKNYDVIVFATDLSYKNKNLLLKMVPSNFNLRIYNISEYTNEQFTNIKFFAKNKWSISIFYRLFIPFVMQNYHKILYLDSDICINHNIDELFDIDMEDVSLLAVKDTVSPILYKHQDRKKQMQGILKLENPERYFNSGMLMFYLKNIDLEKYKQKMIESFKISELLFPDQDILNIIFQHDVKLISAKYNYIYGSCACGLQYLDQISGEYKKDFLEARADPYVIHYTNPKPWVLPSYEYADVFWHYAFRSPYFAEIIYANNYDRCVKKEQLKK